MNPGHQSSADRCWTLSRETLARAESHAVAEHPREACGVLFSDPLKSDRIVGALPSRNTAAGDHSSRYAVDPVTVLAAFRREDRGEGEVAGFYHSHPDSPPLPSAHDCADAWEGYLYLIISVRRGTVAGHRAWTWDFREKRFREADLRVANPQEKR